MYIEEETSHKRKNLLLVTFDQWRGDWGDPWNPIINLPTIEKLGKVGWTARRCYTSSPHCVPARFSWLTGLSPSQMKLTRNYNVDLPADSPSIVRELQKSGWKTSLVGKSHWTSHAKAGDLRNNHHLMKELGFDRVLEVAGPRALRRMSCKLTDDWEKAGVKDIHVADLLKRYGKGLQPEAWEVRPSILPRSLYPDIWIAEKALGELTRMPSDRPWLLWVSFVGPHEPFDTPRPWHGKHRYSDLPMSKPLPEWINKLSDDNQLKKLANNWSGKLTQDAINACRADYADHLRLLDDQLGLLIKKTEEREDINRSDILITADHGELLGDANLLYKGALLEGAIRVPFIYKSSTASFNSKRRKSYTNKPLPLTELLVEIFRRIKTNDESEYITKWVSKQKGAIVEFGNERVLIQGQRKLNIDYDGNPLWAINLNKDPGEQVNEISENSLSWKFSIRWHRLRRWGVEITKKRSSLNWVWRQLGPD